MKTIPITLGFISAVICLAWHVLHGRDLLYTAYASCCVMFAVAIIVRLAKQGTANVLMQFLQEQQRLQEQARSLDASDENGINADQNPAD